MRNREDVKEKNRDGNTETPTALNRDLSSATKMNPWIEALVRIAGTSTIVGTVFYPYEVFLVYLQTGTKLDFGLNPFMSSHHILRPLIQGYCASQKASFVKNSVLSHKETVSEYSGKDIFLTTFIIASFDTLLTQYFSNKRVLNALGIPLSLNWKETVKFGKQGILMRGSKNFMTTLGCISATTAISDLISPFLSKKDHEFSHTALTSFIGGFVISPFSNMMDIIYKTKIKQFTPISLKTPRYRDVISQLWQADGIKVFKRGLFFCSFSNGLAFFLVNGVNDLMDRYLFAPPKKPSESQKFQFFAPAPDKPFVENGNTTLSLGK